MLELPSPAARWAFSPSLPGRAGCVNTRIAPPCFGRALRLVVALNGSPASASGLRPNRAWSKKDEMTLVAVSNARSTTACFSSGTSCRHTSGSFIGANSHGDAVGGAGDGMAACVSVVEVRTRPFACRSLF